MVSGASTPRIFRPWAKTVFTTATSRKRAWVSRSSSVMKRCL